MGFDIENKHKLASDIMNYAKRYASQLSSPALEIPSMQQEEIIKLTKEQLQATDVTIVPTPDEAPVVSLSSTSGNSIQQSWILSVADFHQKFGVDIGEIPELITRQRFALRYRIMMEEIKEMATAFRNDDLVGVADAIIDQLYVTIGTAIEFGLHGILDKMFQEVHRSNMSKLDENGNPVRREDGKVLKSKLYSPPNLHQFIHPLLNSNQQ
jgi:predicted HAD superfamily Cof-like phosphohydrolase